MTIFDYADKHPWLFWAAFCVTVITVEKVIVDICNAAVAQSRSGKAP